MSDGAVAEQAYSKEEWPGSIAEACGFGYPMNFEPLLSHPLLTLLIMKAEDMSESPGPILPAW
jgi:hypothetical protein